jgi:hypothetical protein
MTGNITRRGTHSWRLNSILGAILRRAGGGRASSP